MVDVAIVGGGPVGVSMSIALSTLGVTNVILERETAAYPLPRAIVMDAEIHRSMIRHGLGDELAACLSPMKAADFVDADGVRLMGIELAEIRLFGLPVVSRHYQPELEAVLRHAAQQRGAALRLGVAVTSVAEQHDRVCIECDDGTTVEASWLVGCDGASSTVRKAIGISLEDLGFDQDWLVVDLLVPEKRDSGLPDVTRQVCDPRRPTTLVSGHGDYYRFEFQLQPNEIPAEMRSNERVWQLLSQWIAPDKAKIVRTATYRFHAVVADTFRRGRTFIAGDAAHQMPPFMGQGLNSGMRDVFNLAWKLAYVQRGWAEIGLLDTYSSERIPHAYGTVAQSVETGRLIDQLAGRTSHGVSPDAGYGGSRKSLAFTSGVVIGTGPAVGEPFAAMELLPDGKLDSFTLVSHDSLPDFSTMLPIAKVRAPASTILAGEVVVVRPDGYVAAVCSTSRVAEVVAELARCCRMIER